MTDATANAHPVDLRLFAPGRKRILTLDGGGVRGIVTIAFLKEMERQLREATGKKELVLADVFDMIAGTSVGSMLATMLALGKDMAETEAAFRELAPKIFDGRDTRLGQKRFDARQLVNGVRKFAKDETLGSTNLRTGLAIIAKRADSGSVWLLTNNSRMPFFHDSEKHDGNKGYKLESLIRASTAAPFLFTPHKMTIHTDRQGREEVGWFVDGGVSPHNNPSLLMLLAAGMPSYHLNWALSPDDLMMINVGTGAFRSPVDPATKPGLPFLLRGTLREDITEAAFAAQVLQSMISDAGLFVLQMMQSVSTPRFAWKINGEIRDLDGELLRATVKGLGSAGQGLLRFQRYDLPLERACFEPKYAEFDVAGDRAERLMLQAIDDARNIDRLYVLATEAAKKQVSLQDFAGFI